MDVNERIRALMEERGWTPYRLAKESGLSEGTVGNIFRRNTVPSTATLQAICGGLKITLSQFFAEGEMIELTPELKELFGDWVNLTADQKDAVRHMIPKRQMGCDSQLTVKPRKNSASLVNIILFSSCQMHPTKQEVHPTFQPVHPTCRIVSKWPTFSTKVPKTVGFRNFFGSMSIVGVEPSIYGILLRFAHQDDGKDGFPLRGSCRAERD